MASPPPDPVQAREFRAAELFADFVQRREGGEKMVFERWVRGHPALERELRELHEGWEEFEALLGRTLSSTTSFIHRPHRKGVADPGAVMAEARPGMVIGEFELCSKLGQGGMGQVWEASQPSLDRHVALKLIRPDRTTADSIRFFEREARAGGRLNHPSIVSVYATGEAEGVRWIAQELVPGGCTLNDFVQDMRALEALPPDYDRRIARFFVDVADALQTAHDADVVHRDIKPQNVLVTPDDRPKVTDFGLARLMDEGSVTGSALAGTPQYMSPEQASAQVDEIDHRTDVFSLGALLYEALTLRRPFDGETQGELYERITRHDPPDPRSIRPDVPRDLAVIALKALEKRKEDRYPTMSAFAEDLRRHLDNRPILAAPPGPLRRAHKWVLRHPTASATLALVAVLAVALLGLLRATGEAQEALTAAESQRRENHMLQVQWASEAGDFASAQEHLELANAIDPEDPDGHLLLAIGYLQFGRPSEAESQFDRAIEKGFRSEGEPVSAREHFHDGLFHYYRYLKDASQAEELDVAERHMSEAWRLDPALHRTLYPLYQVRNLLGDEEGALEALTTYQERLPRADDFYPIVEALRLEMDGDLAAAATTLNELAARPGVAEERLRDLRFHRVRGRIALKAGDLAAAEHSLTRAVEQFPADGPSWVNLANAHLRSAYLVKDPDAALWGLRQAVACAERAFDAQPRHEPLQIIADAGIRMVNSLLNDGVDPGPLWEQAQAGIERLREWSPGNPWQGVLEGRLLFQEARRIESFGGPEGGEDVDRLYEKCLEANPLELRAWVRVAQSAWFRGDYPTTMDGLRTAMELWSQTQLTDDGFTGVCGPVDRRWYHAILVWTFGTSPRVGDLASARSARGLLEAELAAGMEILAEELLSFAEFLATVDGVRDCDLALALIEGHALREVFVGEPAEAEAAKILAKIDAACP